jgi:hypothetical protein
MLLGCELGYAKKEKVYTEAEHKAHTIIQINGEPLDIMCPKPETPEEKAEREDRQVRQAKVISEFQQRASWNRVNWNK